MSRVELETKWTGEGFAFDGIDPQGQMLRINSSGEGFRPMQLLLMGLAGCTGGNIISILQKKRLGIAGLSIRVQAERAEEHPKVFTDIVLTYQVHGWNIPASAVEQAIELSEKKYCSASAMLGESARITTRYELSDESQADLPLITSQAK